MRWESRHNALKFAIAAAVAAIGITSTGCERAADVSAMSQVKAGDYKAAAGETDASPAIARIANSYAANETYYGATDKYQALVGNQINVAGELWRLNTIAILADQIAASSQYLLKHNPEAAIQAINTTVQQVQGANEQAWVAGNTGVQVPTISALQAQANQLKDKIAEVERQLASVQQKRQQVMQQSMELMSKSEAAKGEDSVNLFRQASDLRKQGTQLLVEIQNIENQLLPLRQELAQVQAGGEVIAQVPEVMAAHRDMVERSWRGISSQVEQRMNAATSVFSRGERTGGIMAHAAKVSELLVEQDQQASEYEQQVKEAIGYASTAVNKAEQALREANAAGGRAKHFQSAMDPSTARFTQAHMEHALGSQKNGRALMLASRARTAQTVSDVAKRLNQQVPEGLDPQQALAAKQEAAQQASESLKSAVDLFANASGAGSAPQYTRDAADIGQMSALHASALAALIQDDAASVKQFMEEAIVIRDRMASAGKKLPSLPPSLMSNMPATAPANAVENP